MTLRETVGWREQTGRDGHVSRKIARILWELLPPSHPQVHTPIYIYIYICVCVYLCIHIYIYIYIYRVNPVALLPGAHRRVKG